MCFPFATDIDVEDIASKIGSLFQLDITAVENEMLSLQNDRDEIQGIDRKREDLETAVRR